LFLSSAQRGEGGRRGREKKLAAKRGTGTLPGGREMTYEEQKLTHKIIVELNGHIGAIPVLYIPKSIELSVH
jgi:hypothetical protein